MSQKKKKRTWHEPRLPQSIFLILWTLTITFLWGPFAGVLFSINQAVPVDGLMSIVGGLTLGVAFPVVLLLGMGGLMKLQYGWSLRRWVVGTVVGALLSAALIAISSLFFSVLYSFGIPSLILSNVLNGIALMPFLAMQVWVLRRYVRHAWLWGIGLIAAGMVGFTLSQSISNVSTTIAASQLLGDAISLGTIHAGIQRSANGFAFGLVTGLVLLAMVNLTRQQHTRDSQQATIADDDAAAQRLAAETAATTYDDAPTREMRQSAQRAH